MRDTSWNNDWIGERNQRDAKRRKGTGERKTLNAFAAAIATTGQSIDSGMGIKVIIAACEFRREWGTGIAV